MYPILLAYSGPALRSVAYVLVAALCVAIAYTRNEGRPHPPLVTQWRFWMVNAAILLALGLVRELQITHIIGGPVRDFAHDHDLYNQRRPFQELAVVLIALGGIVVGAIGVWYLRAYRWWELLTMLGMVFVLSFLGIRAVSLHNIDQVLFRDSIAGVHVGILLEFAGILFVSAVALGAYVDVRNYRTAQLRS